MRRTLFAVVLLLGTLAATMVAGLEPSGPFVVFTGRVMDDATGGAIAGVRVALDGTRHSTFSGGTGHYQLMVPRSELTGSMALLTASRAGYRSASAALSVAADSIAADFRLIAGADAAEPVAGPAESAAADRSQAEMSTRATPPANFAGPATGAAGYPGHFPGGGWNTESYSLIVENTFLATAGNPLSTFAIDVDRASYSNVRRFLREGQLPPKDAVRIEEMVNYFTYGYPTGEGEHPFGVTTEVAPAPWRKSHLLLRIGLASPRIETSDLPPSNLVFLLDVSGSMMSPDKLPLVKQSMRLLVGELRPADRVAIVVYAGAAGVVLPPTSGSEKEKILDAIEGLEAGGSTAGGEGLRLAYRVARDSHLEGGNNRVILATDGDFNVGVSSDAEMIRLVESHRDQGTFLTVLGFGTGNLKDSKMERMADHGNGNYAYIDSLLEARKVLVTELGGTLATVAKDVKLQIEFNPAVVRAHRLIGYENRLLAAEDFNDDAKDAGELGAGHTVTALYEIIPAGVESDVEVREVDPLRYQREPGGVRNMKDELAFVRVRYKKPTGERSVLLEQPVRVANQEPTADMDFAAAVAGFGMLLRESEHLGSFTAEQVIALARRGGADEEGERADFVGLVEAYRSTRGVRAEEQ